MSRSRKPPPEIPGTVRFMCLSRHHGGIPHREAVARLSDGELTAVSRIRERPRPGGGTKWQIACRCGLDVQVERGVLAELAIALFAVSPGALCVDVPLGVLAQAAGDRLRPFNAERAREIAAVLAEFQSGAA